MQMCDGLARNLLKELETILANCLAHGRRNFVELHDRFPEECRHVIKAFRVIYHNDKIARDAEMSADARLALQQSQSKPTMDNLHVWLQRQLSDKLVEPNSALAAAINYLLKRWERLTLFLRKTGAPLDNNLCERALKKAIMHRKNSMFYKPRNGACVGDMCMSLIDTCDGPFRAGAADRRRVPLHHPNEERCNTKLLAGSLRSARVRRKKCGEKYGDDMLDTL